MLTAMARLDDLERRGYFGFARGGTEVLDRVVTSFADDDIEQLGDNIVLILNTIKEMTQPEIMRMLQRTAQEVRDAEVEEIGLFRLMWRMRNPAVRRGLSRVLKVLESLADVDTVVLDKTGTVTLGRLELLSMEPMNGHDEDDLLRQAVSCAAGSRSGTVESRIQLLTSCNACETTMRSCRPVRPRVMRSGEVTTNCCLMPSEDS